MRSIVNAYGAWLDKMDSGDAFDAVLGAASMIGLIMTALCLLIAAILIPIIVFTSQGPPHGSCKVGHYQFTGKVYSFYCDEYYPAPKVVEGA